MKKCSALIKDFVIRIEHSEIDRTSNGALITSLTIQNVR